MDLRPLIEIKYVNTKYTVNVYLEVYTCERWMLHRYSLLERVRNSTGAGIYKYILHTTLREKYSVSHISKVAESNLQ